MIEASAGVDVASTDDRAVSEVHLPEEKTLDDTREIAATVVRFVARTQETVVRPA